MSLGITEDGDPELQLKLTKGSTRISLAVPARDLLVKYDPTNPSPEIAGVGVGTLVGVGVDVGTGVEVGIVVGVGVGTFVGVGVGMLVGVGVDVGVG